MRMAMLLALIAGCGGPQTGFQHTTQGGTDAGHPHMTLSADHFEWTDCETKKGKSSTLLITSDGDSNLVIRSIKIVDDPTSAFYVKDQGTLTVGSGDKVSVDVIVDLPDMTKAQAKLEILSNDSDNPVMDLPLVGVPLGWTDTASDSGS